MPRLLDRALPRARHLGTVERRLLIGGFAVLAVLLAVTAANAVFGIGGRAAVAPIRNWVSSAIYILVAGIVAVRALRAEHGRLPWVTFALGLTLYGIGNVLWSLWIGTLSAPPIPSLCDGLWLSFYPLSYAGIIGLAEFRNRRRPPAGIWVDGIIAGSGLAAIGAALVFQPVLAAATGSTAAVATELAYPIADLLLAALVVVVLALRGWQADRGWVLLGGGFLALAVADCMYAVQVAGGAATPSPMTNFVYVLGVGLMALATWQGPSRRTDPHFAGWSVLFVPAAFIGSAIGLLLYDHFHPLDPLAFGLATLTLIAGVVRMGLAFRDVRGLTEARRLAATDDLTELPNRRQFMARVDAALAAGEGRGAPVAVLMLDLDNFKQLNDTLGHHAGDELLRSIGPRLEEVLRDGDAVARLGGDEFAVLLAPAPPRAVITDLARRLLDALAPPFAVNGLSLRVTGSLGIASCPADATEAADAAELLRHADIAMYQAKAARSGVEHYAHDRDRNSTERLTLAGELAIALEAGEVDVHFQPKVQLAGRGIVGAEALIRWRRSDGRWVAPIEIVAALEHAGLSRRLTAHVLGAALGQARRWRDAGHDLHVAVNTTVADLLDSAFPAEVDVALAHHGVPADALVLEVTETSVLADPERIGSVLHQLRELGVTLSLDDFGTGYSSLAHVKTLPVQELKIDRAFVARMCSDDTDSAIVYAMIQLAHKLGIRIVAEGVEDAATAAALAELECELIQGYLVGRPVPADALTGQLASGAPALVV